MSQKIGLVGGIVSMVSLKLACAAPNLPGTLTAFPETENWMRMPTFTNSPAGPSTTRSVMSTTLNWFVVEVPVGAKATLPTSTTFPVVAALKLDTPGARASTMLGQLGDADWKSKPPALLEVASARQTDADGTLW